MIAALRFEFKINLNEIITQIASKELLLVVVLFIGIVASALSLSYQRYWNRSLYSTYQNLISEANVLEVERRQLIVEYRTWSNSNRVALIARDQLDMDTVKLNKIIMV